MKAKRIIIWALALLTVLSFIFTGCGQQPSTKETANTVKAVTWKVQTPWVPGDVTEENCAKPMFKSWEEASGGLLKIDEYPAGALCDPPGMPDAVGSRALDAAYALEVWAEKMPAGVGEVQLSLPYSWTAKEYYDIYYNTEYHKIVEDLWARFDCIALGPNPSGQNCFSTNFPINKLEDFAGKKVYCLGGPSMIIEAGGGSVVMIPETELYMALQMGTVNGMLYTLPELVSLKYGEVIKYVLMPSVGVCGGSYIVNKKSWEALPADLQVKMKQLVKDAVVPVGDFMLKKDAEALDTVAAQGVKVNTLSDTEVARWRTIAIKYWDEVAAKSPEAGQLVKIVKDYYAAKK
jgi:TRAP-type C4-dicarboxylate transport system substrate-binding protein